MRHYRVALLVGMAAGAAALTAGFSAHADPTGAVEQAWPFGDFQLPGYSAGAHLTGWPVLTGTEPYTAPDGDYSAHFTGVEAAFVGYLIHREVFDSANPTVPNGTTWDGVSLPGFSDTVIVAPGAGIGDQVEVGSLINSLVIDTAGVHDVLTLGDYPPVTLFDVPADLTGLFAG